MRVRLIMAALVATAGVAVCTAPAFAAAPPTQQQINQAKSVLQRGLNSESAKHCVAVLAGGGDASADDCQQAPSPLKPANNEIIWGSAAFLVLLLAMFKWGVPAVRNMETAREDRIRTDLETAESAKTEAETSLAQYRAQIANANAEAQAIVDDARKAADNVRQDLIARAEADATAIREKANEDTQLAVDRARVDLNRQVASMSVELAGKIVERNLDQSTQQQLIDSYIASVGSN
ncbi:MAG TPA: F0F1 ATP synthase subunit B [Acidimicrobiia bacterium]